MNKSSKILLDNSLNVIVTLELDSLQYNGVTFKKGDTVTDIDGTSFIITHFELSISRWNKNYKNSVIMIMGETEGTNIEYFKKEG